MTADRKTVVLTRKRCAVYMLAYLIASIIIAVFAIAATGTMRFATAPMIVLPLWAMLYFGTPKAGMETPTIGSSPGAILMLWTMAGVVQLTLAVSLVDIYVLGHPINAPLEPYHLALFAPTFILMLAGAYYADRLKKSQDQSFADHGDSDLSETS